MSSPAEPDLLKNKSLPRERPALRLAVALAGIAAVAALLWFAGPLLTLGGAGASHPLASEPARMGAIAALLLLVLAGHLVQRLRASRRNRALLAGLGAAAAGVREVTLIGERFDQALKLLRGARFGRQRPWLAALLGRPLVDELPWYVIIGAPGSGKTTALVNSGLEFPLAGQVGEKVVRGVGGTRHCDWWFTSDAVLIDTAGRYTTQDSDRETDRTAWQGFLALLRRHRPRRPLNGVLLTLSANDLLASTPERRRAHAAELRERLDELHQRLGVRLPVYVIVTKTDLLAGFTEFFAEFDKDERAQVWGATFAADAAPAAQDVARELAALDERLHQRMLDRLAHEADRERRTRIHAFPPQWRALSEHLAEFLRTTLSAQGASSSNAVPWMRGVYFTSATQDGTPMDRAIGGLARRLGLQAAGVPRSRAAASGKSFFMTRLLRDVVFAEAGLAGRRAERSGGAWRRAAGAGALAFSALLLAGAAALGWLGYERSSGVIERYAARLPVLDDAVAQARRADASDLTAVLPALDALEALKGVAPRAGHIAERALDRREMLAAAGADSYRRALREAFLPRIAQRLEQRLREGAETHVDRTYETLRGYLMLFGGKNFDRLALRGFLIADWNATLPASTTPDQRAALRRHLDRLLAGGEVGAPSNADAKLIAQARARIAGVPLAQRAWLRLQQIDVGLDAPGFSLEAAGGPATRRVLARAGGAPLADGVPALYTSAVAPDRLRARVQEVLRELSHEQGWVLGLPGSAPAAVRAEEVERLYAAEYARHWQALVADLRLAPTPTLDSTAALTQQLAQADSPLPAVMRAIARETASGPLAVSFAPLRAQVEGIDKLQPVLARVAAQLAAVQAAQERKAVPQAADATHELVTAAAQAPEPLRAMLSGLASTAATQSLAALREPLGRELAREVAPACTRAVSGRYPFTRGAREEVSREDFARLFGEAGTLDAFYDRHLARLLDTLHRSGASAPALELAPFQRAQALREAFFRDGGRTLGTRLEFRLIEMDAGASEFSLDIDGQPMRFKRDAKATQAVQWPSANVSVQNGGRVHVQVVPSANAGYTFDGPWALLRLLDRVRVEPGPTPQSALLSFDVEGRKARFEVRSASAHNPLLRQALEPFACPARL